MICVRDLLIVFEVEAAFFSENIQTFAVHEDMEN